MRHIVLGLMLMIATVAASGPDDPKAQEFVREMIRGVGATPASCDQVIHNDARQRRMSAICARFDGDFQAFEERWTLFMLYDAYQGGDGGTSALPHSEPQTAWENRGEIHERVYVVGRSVVGVRFHLGEIIIVYTIA